MSDGRWCPITEAEPMKTTCQAVYQVSASLQSYQERPLGRTNKRVRKREESSQDQKRHSTLPLSVVWSFIAALISERPFGAERVYVTLYVLLNDGSSQAPSGRPNQYHMIKDLIVISSESRRQW